MGRHGARIDAADKHWHLTSPTPYDPPLTYGGWTQSRALGARIASILRAREALDQQQVSNGHFKRSSASSCDGLEGDKQTTHPHRVPSSKKRKQKIVLHTSPFLRCVQTSIAIGAGIAQYQGLNKNERSKSHPRTHHRHSGSSHIHSVDYGQSAHLSAIKEPDENPYQLKNRVRTRTGESGTLDLRLDAFLGEWLSPDYYDDITPPPSSILMIAGAKADLLRRGEPVEALEKQVRSTPSYGSFPGGWGNGSADSEADGESEEDGPLSKLSGLSHSLPMRDRASSHSSDGSPGRSRVRVLSRSKTIGSSIREGYEPPTPNYAISFKDMIPPGYVEHARDACIDVDLQWDSMKPPQEWGDGGEYGEEWSSMHKRFRKGLQNMIMWYRAHGTSRATQDNEDECVYPEDEEEDDTDIVLILVTHGAGCNALIGALTNQPVLLDVGMASLTMAVRKDSVHDSTNPSPRRRSSIDLGVSDDYDVQLVASTDHLRTGVHPLVIPQLQPSPRGSSISSFSSYRQRMGSATSNSVSTSPIDGPFGLPEPGTRAMSSVGFSGGLQRSSSNASTASSTGLWSKPQPSSNESLREMKDRAASMSENQHPFKDKKDEAIPASTNGVPTRSNSQRGLWGASPQVIASERVSGPKRRWTVLDKT